MPVLRLPALLAVLLLTSLLTVVVAAALAPAPRAAAAPPLSCGDIYTLQVGSPHRIWRVDTGTGAQRQTTNLRFVDTNLSSNAMGVSADGSTVYAVVANGSGGRWVYQHTLATEQTSFVVQVPNNAPYTHGAADLESGVFYFGGIDTNNVLTVYGVNPSAREYLGVVARGRVPGPSGTPGNNGDFAFDNRGHLYVSSGGGGVNVVSVLDQPLPTSAVSTPVAITATELTRVTTAADQAINGVGFDGEGYLYLTSATTLFKANPSSGAVEGNVPLANAGGDVGSCSAPSTIEVAKDFPDGRKAAGDQVTLSVTGGGITRGNTATTAGNAPGVQAQVAGPVLALTGQRYTVSETGAGAGNPGYNSTWRCVDRNDGAEIASGTGTSGSFVMPASGVRGIAALCTFRNETIRPAIALEKTADKDDLVVGETITYSFKVTNTGNTPLQDVDVDETSFDGAGTLSDVTCPGGVLQPGDAVTCTATYEVQQADVDQGQIVNTATASGTPTTGGDRVTSPEAQARVPHEASPSLSLVKSTQLAQVQRVGQPIRYSFEVTNTGDVTVRDLTIDEVAFNGTGSMSAVDCPETTLAPGARTTCTATYTTTQADFDAGGPITNTATANGAAPDGSSVVSPESSAAVEVVQSPALEVEKLSDAGSDLAVGDEITYTFWVTNTGNVSIDEIGIEEQDFSGAGELSPISCPDTGPIGHGEQVRCTATYTVTQEDVENGGVTNTASARGSAPDGSEVTSPPDSVTDPIEPDPQLSLEKKVSPTTIERPGQRVVYTFVITNTGNVTLHGVGVDETAFSGTGPVGDVNCPPAAASMRPGASVECWVAYTVTQEDFDSGENLTNTARATGKDPSDAPLQSAPDDAVVELAQSPSLSLVKSADRQTLVAGETITYSFVVTNTGNVTLTDVAVAEGDFNGTGSMSDISCPSAASASLAPGAQMTCTATYRVQQADVDRGRVDNTATASGTPPSGDRTTSEPGDAHVPQDAQPSIRLEKRADPQTVQRAGDVITYSFVVTNTGNVTLTDPSVREDGFTGSGEMSAIACPDEPSSLLPGEQITCTATYAVTQADLDRGDRIDNTATAAGTPPSGDPVRSAPADASVEVAQSPDISLVKSVEPADRLVVGETLTYSFVVTNTGNLTLTDVAVREGEFTGAGEPSGVTCPTTTLAPGDQVTCTATYVVQQEDVDAGRIYNSAFASGTAPDGTRENSQQSEAVVPQDPRPGLVLAKSASPDVVRAAGDVVTYTFELTNTGNVSISEWTIEETSFNGSGVMSALACDTAADTALRPGQTVTCTATYEVTQADVDRGGDLDNSAVAHGTTPGGDPVAADEDRARVPLVQEPALTLEKSADTDELVAGATITYSFVVTNTGNVTLTDLGVTEGAFNGSGAMSAVDCGETTSLAPGEQAVCTATYEVTQEDVDRGDLTNTATASGTPPSGDPVTSPEDRVAIPQDSAPGLRLEKSADPASYTAAGEEITYRFVLTNTGNVTLTDLTVAEGDFSGTGEMSAISCPDTPLRPGEQATCTASYRTTQADVDAGRIDNTATAEATPPRGDPVRSEPDSAEITAEPDPAVEVVKQASPVTVVAVGDVITYTFTVTNTGNVTLSDVAVDDRQEAPAGELDGPITCADTTLAPGAETECTATYTVTQADLDHGSVNDTATASGTPPGGGDPVTSPPSDASVSADPRPALEVVKQASPATVAAVGDVITYTFTVTNTGNVTLSDVAVDDRQDAPAGDLDGPITCADTTLAPGAETECTATYTVTQADLDHGSVNDTATASGTPPGSGDPVTSPPSDASVAADRSPSLALAKAAAPETVAAVGDVITYTFTVTNTGNVTLTDLAIDDRQAPPAGRLDAAPSCGVTRLAPGAETTCSATYTVTQADLDHGRVDDTATASGTPPGGGDPVTSNEADASVAAAQAPAIAVAKAGTPAAVTRVGEQISYTFTVTNTGNVTLTDIAVEDRQQAPAGDLDGPVACPASTLVPGASTVCTATYTVTAADLEHGRVDDTATASGTPPAGDRVVSDESSFTVPTDAPASYDAAKTADPASGSQVEEGQRVRYTLTVTNTGEVPLRAPVSDDLSGVLDDATYAGDVAASIGTVTISGTRLTWTGAVPPGQTLTIRYSVVVKAYSHQGNHVLDNALTVHSEGGACGVAPVPRLQRPPSRGAGAPCVTSHRTVPPGEVGGMPPAVTPLPDTGGPPARLVLGGLLLVLAGVSFVVIGVSRRRRGGAR
ncbi:hypothetical protein ACIRN4_26355 [Pimelobacter simplex]|uniref:DUF7507 domain-containing protein n=1 Tax=Nocardioides simplex TaxID=2045 RepID=UPI0037F7FBC4